LLGTMSTPTSISPNKSDEGHPVLFFDGVCALCNGLVKFVIRQDTRGKVRFSTLQSPLGQEVLRTEKIAGEFLETVLYKKEGVVFQKSDAVLELLNDLGGFWKLARLSKILPRIFRDFLYDGVARSRYSIFGKYDQCMVPGPEIRKRFLD
jgi:predicted DCC family thiol-disulfide oxidoreductase YuxK